MRVKFWHSLYNRVVEYVIVGDIDFKDGKAYFKHMGHGVAIECDRIVSIERIEED